MATRTLLSAGLLCCLALASCDRAETGPVAVSAIGEAPKLANPNLQLLDAPSALLVENVAQGLVRFDAAGQIEPALAQRWIVSDDGLHYVFRLAPAEWQNGGKITAEQVADRLRAAGSRASRNPLKPILGAVDEIVAMTDEVIEISLKSPRPNFLQVLAQPEMAILRGDQGAGPYRPAGRKDGAILLEPLPNREETAETADTPAPPIMLRGERAGVAVARFERGLVDLVTGGTAGDLAVARAARLPARALTFDPAAGLFGLAFARAEGRLADPAVRRALSMAIDRGAMIAALGVPELRPRETLLPAGVQELPQPARADWSANPLPMRREQATRAIEGSGDEPLSLRVAIPEGPGYRLVFAHLRRDWRAIGVAAEAVAVGAPAELRLIDALAPVNLASWYLRTFSCETRWVCDPAADEAMAGARIAPTAAARRELLANADRILATAVPFIPIAAPVRWSLVSPRLTGFRANVFARHAASELIAPVP